MTNMTNKEAIEILKPLFEQCKGTNKCMGYIEHYFSKDEEKALDLAIDALQLSIAIDNLSEGIGTRDFSTPEKHTHCVRCGKKLKNPVAQERGYGDICWQKQLHDNQTKLF